MSEITEMLIREADTDSMLANVLVESSGSSEDQEVVYPLHIEFPVGLPGFEQLHGASLAPMGDDVGPFMRLTYDGEEGISFVLVPPGVLFEDYSVEIYNEYITALGIEGPADAVVLVIMTVVPPPAECTVNLLGPLVINRRNLKAAQVVQYTSDYQVAVPISAATAHWASSRGA